jgi:hypothetical protein
LAQKYVTLDGTIRYQHQGKGKDALRRRRGEKNDVNVDGGSIGLPHPHMVVLAEWAEEFSKKRQINPTMRMRDRLIKLAFSSALNISKRNKSGNIPLFRFNVSEFLVFLVLLLCPTPL